jgi:hypothetical protein
MTYFDHYLTKQKFIPKIKVSPLNETAIIVIVPCYNEPDIITSLNSLWNCVRPKCSVEVICIINASEESSTDVIEQNKISYQSIIDWASTHITSDFQCYAIDASHLPKKFAGVGLARKIGMDEAIYRFSRIKTEHGLICSFDADAEVDNNYFIEIENHFEKNPKCPGASIYFEHPVNPLNPSRFQSGIIQYETHLRYLLQSIRFINFPYAFHTVGSSFVVKASAYVKQGGMNRFKAGEDFYFLNKIIPLGNFSEINTTRVTPSCRVSDRVPFGTGASMTKWITSDEPYLTTYSFESFLPLAELFKLVSQIHHKKSLNLKSIHSETLTQFLSELNFETAIHQALTNSSSLETFSKRFFGWFDAFQIVKYLNYASTHGFDKKAIHLEAPKLLRSLNINYTDGSELELLNIFRNLEIRNCKIFSA